MCIIYTLYIYIDYKKYKQKRGYLLSFAQYPYYLILSYKQWLDINRNYKYISISIHILYLYMTASLK